MKANFFITISLLFFQNSFSQHSDCSCNYIENYYQFAYQGQYHFLKENYDSAYYYFKLAEKGCPLKNHQGINEIYSLAESSVRLNKPDEALKYLEFQLKNGYKFEYLEVDSTFQELWDTKGWNQLKKKSDEIYEKWYSELNLDLRGQIIKMIKEDQRVRTIKPIDFDEMKRVDSINIYRLKEIIKEFGYPTANLVGNYSIDNQHADIGILIFHIQEENDIEFFKSILLEFVKCSSADSPGIYADLIDSNDRRRGMFTYGIYGNVEAENIDDFENLDKRRISAGLAPWELQKEIQRLLTIKYDLPD